MYGSTLKHLFYPSGIGFSKFPCFYDYNGEKAFSEKCTRNIAAFAKTLRRFKLFYDIHSFGQYFLIPFAYSDKVKPEADTEIVSL